MDKIAWVVPSLRSGIGKYTKVVNKCLEQNIDLHIFVAEEGFDIDQLKQFPLVIYNFGNNKESLALYLALRKYPGVILLHDQTYHHFFAYYYFEYIKRPDLYYEALSILYGEDVANYVQREINSGIMIWDTEACIKYPLRELLYPHSTGIIVHSKSFLESILKEYNGVKIYIPFPFEIDNLYSYENIDKRLLNLPNERLILFSYGYISENRMIDEVLSLIGEIDKIRQKIFYVVAGHVHDKYLDKINATIVKYQLTNNVKICGYISNKELYKYLNIADLCINLRKYNTEGASWSVLEQMSYRKAVLAMDNGFFSELPDDVLIKVKDIRELKEKLLKIVQNPLNLKEIGIKAQEYVVKNFNPNFFVNEFLKFLENFISQRNQKKILNKLLKEIIEIIPFMPKEIENKVLSKLAENFCEVFLEANKH